MALLETAIPWRVRNLVDKIRRPSVFKRTMRDLRRILSQEVKPSRDVWLDLIYGWGNEAWSAEPEYLTALWEYAEKADGPILECGSGLSTFVLGLVADKKSNQVWSLEHLRDWADKAQASLESCRIGSVRLCVVGLRDYGPYSWYELPKSQMPSDFSMVVCDGPPEDVPGGRYGLLPVMKSRLKPGCVILLDDVQRPSENAILSRWAAELGVNPTISQPYRTTYKTDHQFAILTVPSSGESTVK